ncbi:MAG: zinc-binding dehydrogenase [Candidatus Latescibacteria bacterium]|nr:zinc-binding dehydrogenase [Candidatus Latescibacterota bacterium]
MRNPTVVFTAPGQVAVEDRPLPVPTAGQLLIQTRRTLISTGTELTILNGQFPPQSRWADYGRFPFVPGYDHIGEVVEVGPEVDRAWLGRRVASYAAHAAYVLGRPTSLRPVHREIPDEEAAFFTLAEIAMNGVRRGQVTWGEVTAVYGLGLLGQLVVRLCRLAGAALVIGVDVAASRLALLPRLPRVAGLDPATGDLASRVEGLNHGRLADVVFELTGNPEAIPGEFALLRRQGRMVLLSSPRGPTPLFDFHDLCNSPSYTIIGAHNSSHPGQATADQPWTQPRHAELFFDLVADGELEIAPLISHRLPYTGAPGIYAALRADRSRAMGVILEWNGAGA